MSWRTSQVENLHIKTQKAIIIGFDADINNCGLCAYDAANDELLFLGTMPYNEINKFIDKFIDEYGKMKIVARVELAVYGTAEGVTRNQNGAALKKIFWHSGRSSALASLFIELMQSKNIPTLIVKSSDRLKFDKFKSLDVKLVLNQIITTINKNKIPSKMSAKHIRHIFPHISRYKKMNPKAKLNSESYDALCLCLRERILNLY